MDQETYKRQLPFAGEKVPTMKRRCLDHDYRGRQIYLITMVTEGRRPLFGRVVGRSDGKRGTAEEPRVELSELGQHVAINWQQIGARNPKIEVYALQMMPDHLHGILFVKEEMEKGLGKVLLGFKQGCNKAYRELLRGEAAGGPRGEIPSVAVVQQQTGPKAAGEQRGGAAGGKKDGAAGGKKDGAAGGKNRDDRRHGLLFERGYNDKLLFRKGQLERWKEYLNDNPRRLLMKREQPDLFRVQRGLTKGRWTFSAIGNRFLLDRPELLQVQCSRSLTSDEIETKKQQWLTAARRGAVLVSPSISEGEKQVMRAAFDEGLPVVYLQENGFTDLAKPGGKRMEACARGQMLILAPWEHHNERTTISRSQCLSLNEMAREICEGGG